MSGFQCPFCQMIMAKTTDTLQDRYPSFDRDNDAIAYNGHDKSTLKLTYHKCPNCGQYTILVRGLGSKVTDVNTILHPNSLAHQFPDYIPEAIRNDYKEACAIVNLSPKASATLSRRCLQGMIRDFWGISKSRLIDEINALEDLVPAPQWKVLNSIRRIGNIGAHPEADINLIIDIEPDNAAKLIAVIELLIKQWYIERHDQEQLYADVLDIDDETNNQRSR